MIEVGQFNKLRVVKEVPFGVYVEGGDWGEILVPNKYVPKGTMINDQLDVFVYFDSDDKIIATTSNPHITVGQCALMKVIDVNRVGAFLDWGLDKDLLVPVPEQQRPMEKGRSYIVYAKLDSKGRIIATSKLDHCLDKTSAGFKPWDEIDAIIAETTELGNKVIINDKYWGLIHAPDIFQTLHYGKRIRAFIKLVREDGKIDVVLKKMGRNNIHELAERIMEDLHKNSGFIPLHDKSSSEDIQRAFGDSKKSFKSAIGLLYKESKIKIESDGIRLQKKSPNQTGS